MLTQIKFSKKNLYDYVLGAVILIGITSGLMAQSGISYEIHSKTQYSIPAGTDLNLLSQSDLATMQPYEEIVSKSIQISEDGNLIKESKVMNAKGDPVRKKEVGYKTITSETGIKTYKPDGSILLEIPFDEILSEAHIEEGNTYIQQTDMLTLNPFAALDNLLSAVPEDKVTIMGGTISIDMGDGFTREYIPEWMIIVDNITDESGFEITIRDVFKTLQDGSIVLGSRTILTSRTNYAGVIITEEQRLEYKNYNISRSPQIEFRESEAEKIKLPIVVYPNPVQEILLVRGLESPLPVEVTIFTIQGQEVLKSTKSAGLDQLIIPVSHLTEGQFIINLRNNNDLNHTMSFIKI